MTEEQELEAMSKALAAADNDPWTPRCVAEAFLRESLVMGHWSLTPLTLGGWLRLESARSPYVTGVFPVVMSERLEALAYAIGVLSGEGVSADAVMQALSGTEAVSAEELVARWINRGFATALPMHRPRKPGEAPQEATRDHGFGWWMRVMTKLVSELGFQPDAALELPLAQAFALLATQALLDGCEPKEMNWKEREALANV